MNVIKAGVTILLVAYTGSCCQSKTGNTILDSTLCDDNNNCKLTGSCSQLHVNNNGTYKCSCGEGFHSSGTTGAGCVPNDPSWRLIYTTLWTHEVGYLAHHKYGSEMKTKKTISTPGFYCEMFYPVTVDVRNDSIFWAADSRCGQQGIFKSSLEEISEFVLVDRAEWVFGLAVDWITGNIYFTSSGNSKYIGVCQIAPQILCSAVLNVTYNMRDIAVEPNLGIMFWVQYEHAILRAGMDGTHPIPILSIEKEVYTLAVDYFNAKVYFATYGDTAIIESSSFDGSNRVRVKYGYSFNSLTIGEFSNITTIESVHKFSGHDKSVHLKDAKTKLHKIALAHVATQPIIRTNPCQDASCSQICVLSPLNGTTQFRCICPTGMNLSDDMKTCRDLSEIKNASTSTVGNNSKPMANCSSQHWQCDNLECIHSRYVCNGEMDCSDCSDERLDYCGEKNRLHLKHLNSDCPSLSYSCRSTDKTISLDKVCDGIPHCEGNEDEENCTDRADTSNANEIEGEVHTCHFSGNCTTVWRCPDGNCIHTRYVYNRINDCADGSDEDVELCGNKAHLDPSTIFATCPKPPFLCNNGTVLVASLVCNGIPDCEGNEDEETCMKEDEESPKAEFLRGGRFPYWTILAAAGIIAIVAIGIAAFYYCWFRQRFHVVSQKDMDDFRFRAKTAADVEKLEELHIFGVKYDAEKYEMDERDFNLESCEIIGRGNFGLVYKSKMARLAKPVAVKTVKASTPEATSLAVRTILREIKIMSFVGSHRNIVEFIGAFTKELEQGVVYVVTELCENGSLLKYLRENRKSNEDTFDVYQLYGFCGQIANGMQYLEEKRVIHGDLSAKNVLVDATLTCKITDFGLSRTIEKYDIYSKKSSEPLPWPWMAIEALDHMEFSFKSDVWSLGVTFWEVLSMGIQPFRGLSWDLEFTQKLRDGLRLPCPELATEDVFAKIETCWHLDPSLRPDAGGLKAFFLGLNEALYEDMGLPPRYVSM